MIESDEDGFTIYNACFYEQIIGPMIIHSLLPLSYSLIFEFDWQLKGAKNLDNGWGSTWQLRGLAPKVLAAHHLDIFLPPFVAAFD